MARGRGPWRIQDVARSEAQLHSHGDCSVDPAREGGREGEREGGREGDGTSSLSSGENLDLIETKAETELQTSFEDFPNVSGMPM